MMEMLALMIIATNLLDVTMKPLVVLEFVQLDIVIRSKDGSLLLWTAMIPMLVLMTGAILLLANVNILISPVMTMILALRIIVVL
jgi:hypothetical protein